MNVSGKRRAGQPIMVFAALLIGWVGLRSTIWESPFPSTVPAILAEAVSSIQPKQAVIAETNAGAAPTQTAADWTYEAVGLVPPPRPITVGPLPAVRANQAATAPQQGDTFASHQLMWLAAMGRLPVPRDVAEIIQGAAARQADTSIAAALPAKGSAKRWSVDGWLFLRPDAELGAATGPRFASYGASQAGAVLRYRLIPGNAVRPTAYVRATKALAAGRETEIAAGLSARPLAGFPVAAYAELRATRGAVTTEIRPAVFAVTEFPSVELPLGFRGEAYLAGGYVGGDFATAFADGQARVDRKMIRFDLGQILAGAGAWGGAQEGAARLDVGPSAGLNLKIGAAPARVSMDYRLRVAGDAEPGSGVASRFRRDFESVFDRFSRSPRTVQL